MMAPDQNMNSVIATRTTEFNPVGADDALAGTVRHCHPQGRVCKIVKPPVIKGFSYLRDAIEGCEK